MRIRSLVAVSAILAVSACSTTPVSQGSAASVPAERIYRAEYVGSGSAADATVVFLRDAGFVGSGCSHDVYVDNVRVFSIRRAEQIAIHVPAGHHFFRLETGGGLCPNISTSQETTLVSGARQTYRILLPSDGGLRLTRIE